MSNQSISLSLSILRIAVSLALLCGSKLEFEVLPDWACTGKTVTS